MMSHARASIDRPCVVCTWARRLSRLRVNIALIGSSSYSLVHSYMRLRSCGARMYVGTYLASSDRGRLAGCMAAAGRCCARADVWRDDGRKREVCMHACMRGPRTWLLSPHPFERALCTGWKDRSIVVQFSSARDAVYPPSDDALRTDIRQLAGVNDPDWRRVRSRDHERHVRSSVGTRAMRHASKVGTQLPKTHILVNSLSLKPPVVPAAAATAAVFRVQTKLSCFIAQISSSILIIAWGLPAAGCVIGRRRGKGGGAISSISVPYVQHRASWPGTALCCVLF
jgi:hypothetical protein